ncbi:uncharacterized protein DEA37_0002184 [Paragonimus westermani]|uniref:G-protein coupled receptors family 1 profile domain-containing protein n=1 Tax=Paragonimus westermani TaxID=34504 RepID=A0A5J4P268_9TREM|nr:uncharacterized protein DEA37_0002184 [Paragonimus westermani]
MPEETGREIVGLVESTMSDLKQQNMLKQHELLILMFICIIFILFGAIGSLSVILVVQRRPRMRTSHNLFTVSLAVGDLLLCLFTQPFNLLRILYWHVDWTLGSVMCKAVETAQATNIFVSTLNISVVAVDRLLVSRHEKQIF